MNTKLNWLGIVAATVVAFFVGFLWYGLIFEATWLELTGTVKSDDMSMLPMLWGLVQTFITMAGLGWFIARDGAGWMNGLKIGLVASVAFALMTSAYGFLYGGQPMGLLPIDWSHLLVIYALGGALIGGLRMKPKA